MTAWRRPLTILIGIPLGFLWSACSRTGLGFDESDPLGPGFGSADGVDGQAPWLDGSVPTDARDPRIPPPEERPPVEPRDERCTPLEERCNGVDDDCDGEVDEVPPTPCPGGGNRYCVGGRMSACPDRCEVCMPGTERVCFLSYCLYWGVQTCAADGRGFGPCREQIPPGECKGVADAHRYSSELEQCCIDNGYCCMDDFDLDGDGNRREVLGRCDEVLCR